MKKAVPVSAVESCDTGTVSYVADYDQAVIFLYLGTRSFMMHQPRR